MKTKNCLTYPYMKNKIIYSRKLTYSHRFPSKKERPTNRESKRQKRNRTIIISQKPSFFKNFAMETHLAKQLPFYINLPMSTHLLPPAVSLQIPTEETPKRVSFRLISPKCLTKSSPWIPSMSQARVTQDRFWVGTIRRNGISRDPSLSGSMCRSPSTARGFRRH